MQQSCTFLRGNCLEREPIRCDCNVSVAIIESSGLESKFGSCPTIAVSLKSLISNSTFEVGHFSRSVQKSCVSFPRRRRRWRGTRTASQNIRACKTELGLVVPTL